jgi:hypothetical protein
MKEKTKDFDIKKLPQKKKKNSDFF